MQEIVRELLKGDVFESQRVKAYAYGLIKYSYIFYLAGFFLFPTRPSHNLVFYFFVVLPSILFFLQDQIKSMPWREPLYSGVIAFLAYCALSNLWAVGGVDRGFLYQVKVFLLLFYFISVPLWIMATEKKPQLFINISIISICGAATLSAIFHLCRYVYEYGLVVVRYDPGGTSSMAIDGGMIFGFASFCMLWFALNENENLKKRALYMLGAILTATVCVLTLSRGPAIAYALVLVATPTFLSMRRDKRLIMFVLVSLCCLIMYYILEVRGGEPSYRLEIWKESWAIAQNKLLFGVGIDSSSRIPVDNMAFVSSHNMFVDTLHKTGLIGVVAQVLLLSGWAIALFSMRSEANLIKLLMLYGLAALMTSGTVLFERPNVDWLVYWLPYILGMGLVFNTSGFASKK